MGKTKDHLLVTIAGLVVGIGAVLLTAFGNPGNMGFCIACFLRDIAGGVKLHSAEVVQYVRPEIIGLVLGAMLMALGTGEFRVRGGSSPALRFVIGFFVMVGALMFLGCPLRMVIRLGGGDGNALFGLAGFAAGVVVGSLFLRKGYSLKKAHPLGKLEGGVLPAVNVVLLVLLVAVPSVLAFSAEGPGSMHAPLLLSLGVSLVIGALAQRARLCMAGGIRDAVLLKDFHLLYGFAAIFAAVLVGNLITGRFHAGFADQPIAFNTLADGNWLWAFLGMALVGVGSVFLGGCPLRQLILAGSGNSDSAIAVLGMTVGAAFCHNFGLASSGAGTTTAGHIALLLGLVVVLLIGWCNLHREAQS